MWPNNYYNMIRSVTQGPFANKVAVDVICANTSSYIRSRISTLSHTHNQSAIAASANANIKFAEYLQGCPACERARARRTRAQIIATAPHTSDCLCVHDGKLSRHQQCNSVAAAALWKLLAHTTCKRMSWHHDSMLPVLNDYHLMVTLKYSMLMRQAKHSTCPDIGNLQIRWLNLHLNHKLSNAAYHGKENKVNRILKHKPYRMFHGDSYSITDAMRAVRAARNGYLIDADDSYYQAMLDRGVFAYTFNGSRDPAMTTKLDEDKYINIMIKLAIAGETWTLREINQWPDAVRARMTVAASGCVRVRDRQ